ncbi:MAG: glutamate-1-semialdehyde 2,1-aminomutase [Chlorobiota bacterium]|nr:MAG: glutamate-1-semialdehyde 2,1-aminomutase [Chlorobiota bacterium]
MMIINKSNNLFERAKKVIPGGVNSPARAFKSVGGKPIFFESAFGSNLTDVDGNNYIDYVGSWGPFILGHNHPIVIEALSKQILKAVSFGAPCEAEVELAEFLCKNIPTLEMVRMVSSGTEATMSAIIVARGYTGFDKIIKFEGCYHGHGDSFLIKAGSGLMTLGEPNSPGVTKGTAQDTLVANFNDIESVKNLFKLNDDKIAAVIIEPICGNMGVIKSNPVFLKNLRELCTEKGTVLIFDEVMTGFRVAFGGASEVYGIIPDMVTYGKIIGGGLPVGAYGGKSYLMEKVSPLGAVYQAGTLSGNPLAVTAGLATLQTLINENPYPKLEVITNEIESQLKYFGNKYSIDNCINRSGSMITLFFTKSEVVDFNSASSSDTKLFAKFFNGMLSKGIYLPPSQFEAWFVSSTHDTIAIEKTLDAAENVFATL